VLTKDMLKYSVVLIPNTFMWWIINSSDRIMITAFLGSSANGIFAVSSKIPTLLSTLVTIFNTAWSYSAIKENESKDKDAYANSVYNGMVMLALVIGALMIFVIKPFLSLYVSADYYTAWRYTPYLVVGFVFLSLASFLGTYYTVNKDSKGFLFSSMIAAGCNLALNYFLIPWLGIAGGAIATAISYIIVFIYRAIDTRKYIRITVFSSKQGISSGLLMIMGGAMFAPIIISYVLMSICLIVILWIYRDTWMMYLATIRKQIKQKMHKK
jgi:O-antigen/teichoic acid export membrane protein